MRRALLLLTCLLFLTLRLRADEPVSLADAQAITAQTLGYNAFVVDGHYAVGDFDGDGKPDLAVVVNVDKALPDIRSRSIQLFDLNTKGAAGISGFSPSCPGLLIVPSFAKIDKKHPPPLGRPALGNACCSGVRVFAKEKPIHPAVKHRPAPHLKNDAMVLEMETGDFALVYWDGQRFQEFDLESAD